MVSRGAKDIASDPRVRTGSARGVPSTADERREALKSVFHEARSCTRCPQLAATRTTVVFGSGHADADLMFVGEAPGRQRGRAAVSRSSARPGSCWIASWPRSASRAPEVFVTNVLQCRPPGNRDPHPEEVEHCRSYLAAKLALVEPRLVCSLGNFATKLLRADPTGITRLHGRDEVRIVGTRAVRLIPLFHPAAALYTPANVEVLRADFAHIPELLALDPPAQPGAAREEPVPAVPEPALAVGAGAASAEQLGLF